MVKPLSSSVLSVLVAAGGLLSAPLCQAQQEQGSSVEMQETARRHMAIRDAMQQVQEARSAYEAKRYTEAVEHYRNALSVLPRAPYTKKQEQFIRDSLSDALIARAIDYRSVGRTEEAIEFLREALRHSPENKRAKQELAYTQDPVRTNPALTPQHVADVEEVSRLLALAYGYYDLGKYDDAIKTFQAVIDIDPYNTAAQRGMESVHKRRSDYYKNAYNARRASMLAEVDHSWEDLNDVSAGTSTLPTEHGAANAQDAAGATPDATELSYARALEQMRIPGVTIENADVQEALDLLQNYINRFESQGTQGQRHINIVGGFGSAETPGYAELMQKRATFRLDDITLKDLMDEVAQRFELDYYYVPMGVEFTYAGQDYGRMTDRVFRVPPHFFDADRDDDDDEPKGFADGSSKGISVRRVNPVEALKRMNISFPKGASASYHAASRRLTVRNTLRNLNEIEQLVSGEAPEEKVIVLNVMVMETTEENLEDLGFEWLLNMHVTGEMYAGGGTEQAFSNATGMPVIAPFRYINNNMSPTLTNGQRSINQVSGKNSLEMLIQQGSVENYQNYNAPLDLSPTIFGLRGIWNSADVTMIMRGLAQKKGTDTLSNPRLVFSPGSEEQVTIASVREMYYPERYDAPKITQSVNAPEENASTGDLNNDGIIENGPVYLGAMSIAVSAQPTDFVRYGLTEDSVGGVGSILQLHNAEITPDGQAVKLALTTTVNDFEGFVDWGTAIYSAMWTSREIQRVFLAPNHIYQPIFKRYMTNSTVTVANGTVLVLGGLKEAKVVRYEDKVPVLGDLPLVGRLFRSEGEKKQRRALLIFAKVDIVDPSGKRPESGEEGISAQSPM